MTAHRNTLTETRLTAAQRRVLAAIKRHIKRHGMPPTRRDICDACGFSSYNAAQEHVAALARKGAIKVNPRLARGIRVLA